MSFIEQIKYLKDYEENNKSLLTPTVQKSIKNLGGWLSFYQKNKDIKTVKDEVKIDGILIIFNLIYYIEKKMNDIYYQIYKIYNKTQIIERILYAKYNNYFLFLNSLFSMENNRLIELVRQLYTYLKEEDKKYKYSMKCIRLKSEDILNLFQDLERSSPKQFEKILGSDIVNLFNFRTNQKLK